MATSRFEASEWVDASLGVELRIAIELGGLELGPSLAGEVLVPFFRPRFVLNTDDDVFTPPEAGAAVTLGLWARLS
jgi:hypothetical protein